MKILRAIGVWILNAMYNVYGKVYAEYGKMAEERCREKEKNDQKTTHRTHSNDTNNPHSVY